ncbi:MAG: hypothetical protein JWL63_1553 [Rhodocyclales bacterium]|nr:hypothetical protein [Rhodocyclales bacterium]
MVSVLPDWQLQAAPRALTQAVLSKAAPVGLDGWTIYHALVEPYEILSERPPVKAVTAGNVERIAQYVLQRMGVQLGDFG